MVPVQSGPANAITPKAVKIFPQKPVYFSPCIGNKWQAKRVLWGETVDRRMGVDLNDIDKTKFFEKIAMPHLDSAYNLARWLTRNDQDAQDLVQTAFLRAYRFMDGYHGDGDGARAWLLTIVRNSYYTSLRDSRPQHDDIGFDEELYGHDEDACGMPRNDVGANPEDVLAAQDVKEAINHGLEALPQLFREVLVLKEIDDLSYKEIADIVGIPLGTVMSRLARARKLLLMYLKQHTDEK
ncbi:sigma-70 family RNA polymerase sigma factor [Janthinobacterium sp. MDB2-8]|uniref:sigma-70 family RNA polymerase sigma factor n=1 Tax=Janthinobacterium sp. MDB2-8 TaxID=1259338 RepID=UPI003F27AC50